MATAGADPAGSFGAWVVHDVLYKLVVGGVGGVVVGRILGRLFFRPRSPVLHLASHAEGFTALTATFLAYGVTELAGGYGFLAVFVCARAIRAAEHEHEYHRVLHDFVEQVERLLTVLLLVLFGGAVVRGVLDPLGWEAVAVGLAVVVVVRPLTLTAGLALRRGPGDGWEKTAIAVFGIRGIGSFYYLAYATSEAGFAGADQVWATAGFVVIVSILAHGMAAAPIMRRIDRARPAADEG
jgi:NhaP-type Na+/H+ or K+/H+ antiporter